MVWTFGLWTLGSWTLGLWTTGHLDFGRLDSWTLDDWTLGLWTLVLGTTERLNSGLLNAWTLDDWTLGPWTLGARKFFPFLVTSISFLLLVNVKFLIISSTLRYIMVLLNVLQMIVIIQHIRGKNFQDYPEW